MRPSSPITIHYIWLNPPHARGDWVSARHGDEVTLSPQHSHIPAPHRGEDQTAESDRAFLVSSLCSTKLHDKKTTLLNYLQCARTPEQARSFRDPCWHGCLHSV